MEFDLLLIIGIILISIVAFYAILKWKLDASKRTIAHLNDELVSLKNKLAQEQNLTTEYKSDIILLEKELVKSHTDLKHSQQRIHELQNNEVLQSQRFENIANKVLQHQSASFTVKQSEGIKNILQPLEAKIQQFEAQITSSNNESIKRHVSLKEQINFLSKQSQQVSEEANNLAKALKGDFKKQGNWGEMILEMILEKSGLQKDSEYFVQNSLKDDHGRIQRPDVIIHLPNNKRLIIDSKVSLVDYNNWVNADTKEEKLNHQKRHTTAIRRHIDQLSAKCYHNLYKMESPDFVLMFIPIDTACSAALSYDPSLYEYGFKKNIIIVAPTTLLATLKTVETLWQNDKQNKYALQIAVQAGKMYDKFVGFTEDMNKIGQQLGTVQKTYQLSMNKLCTGTGNLVSKAEKIKALGAKANKSLSESIQHNDVINISEMVEA